MTEVCHQQVCVSYSVDSFHDNSGKSDTVFQVVEIALWLSVAFSSAKYSDKVYDEQMETKLLTWTVSVQQMFNLDDKIG